MTDPKIIHFIGQYAITPCGISYVRAADQLKVTYSVDECTCWGCMMVVGEKVGKKLLVLAGPTGKIGGSR
jgi:hypothetical protein